MVTGTLDRRMLLPAKSGNKPTVCMAAHNPDHSPAALPQLHSFLDGCGQGTTAALRTSVDPQCPSTSISAAVLGTVKLLLLPASHSR